jgi:hypothetical protein
VRDWAEFKGDPGAGSIPSRYRKAAVLTLDKTVQDERQKMRGGQHAVAFALGTAVMVGALPEGQTFGQDPEDDERYMVSLRIGRDALRATAGLWSSGCLLEVPKGTLVDKSELPVEHVPDYMPLV